MLAYLIVILIAWLMQLLLLLHFSVIQSPLYYVISRIVTSTLSWQISVQKKPIKTLEKGVKYVQS